MPVVGTLAAAGLAACGGSSSQSSNASTAASGGTGTTSAPAPASAGPYTNAAAEVSKLLAPPGTKLSHGAVPGWPQNATGYGNPATPTAVSGSAYFLVDKVHNTQYVSFAVKDTHGRCAGGDLVADANATEVVSSKRITVPSGAPCTGAEVAKLAGHG